MRILIDALSARGGGGNTFIAHILPALVGVAPRHEFHILLSRQYQKNIMKAVPGGVFIIALDLPATPLWRRWLFSQRRIPRILKEGKFDLLFTVTEIGALNVPVPHVVMVRNPNIYAPLSVFSGWRRRLKLLGYRALREPLAYLTLRSADRIVFVSNAFRDQVVAQLRLPREKTRVVYHGVSPIFMRDESEGRASFLRSKLGERPYLLTVSVIYPHKNYETLLDAFALLSRRVPISDLQLVVAGGVSDQGLYLALQKRAMRLGVSDRVHFLGSVEYEKLPGLYRDAVAFVFPSRLESFGHPLVEAMASGTPIVASNLPVCREICGDAALYFNVNDPTELAERICALVENSGLRRDLREAGIRRAKRFSWERTASEMVEIFEEVVEKSTRKVDKRSVPPLNSGSGAG